jgi:hypothetical protein
MPDKMNPQQFAARIRAAHPGVYDDLKDEDLTSRVMQKYPQYNDMVQAAPAQEPGFFQRMGKAAQDITEGAGAGVLNTVHGTGEMIRQGGNLIHEGLGDSVVPPSGQKALEGMTYTNSPMQKLGYVGEQVGEFMLPGAQAEKVGAKAATLLPKVAKYAAPAAKIATEAGVSGLQNKMQGGDFSTGAAFGGGGKIIGEGVSAVAPKIAEAAAAPGKRLLKSLPEGVQNIGRTILDYSKGYKPSTIAGELGEQVSSHSNALNDAAEAAKNRGAQVSLNPARNVVAQETKSASAMNSPGYAKDVGKVGDQLNYQFDRSGIATKEVPAGTKSVTTTSPIVNEFGNSITHEAQVPLKSEVPVRLPDSVDPVRARALKQGIDLEIGNWNPEAQAAIDPLKERVYGALNAEFHSAVPGAAGHDAAMTNLIPAQKAMHNVAYNPGITRSVVERFARPTGALVGGILGAKEGYQEGGLPGAVAGGVGGLVIPHIITSPTGMMVAARAADKGLAPALTKPILPLLRGSKKSKEEEEQDQR